MRKLSIGPLLLLLIVFLFGRFASAAVQDLRGRDLPAQLPAKLPSKKAAVRSAVVTTATAKQAPQKLPAKKIVVKTLPAKPQAKAASKLPAKKQVVISGLPRKLPVFKAKRVQINFEEIPSTPLDQSVVILAPALEVVQDPNSIEIAANSIEALPQALPEKPPQAPEAPEVATVERPLIEILPSEPTGELWQQDPNAVAAQPVTESPTQISEAEALATSSATSSGLTDLEAIAATVAATNAETATSATATDVNADSAAASSSAATAASVVSTSDESASAVSTSADVIESAKLSSTPTEITAVSDSSNSTASTSVSTTSTSTSTAAATATASATASASAVILARVESPRDERSENPNKLFVRAGYLNAKYSELSPELANGAQTFGVSFARTFTYWEAKGSLDFGYGRDQRVNVRNTRLSLARLEGSYLFRNFGFLRPYLGAGGGIANVDVTSYRASENNGELILREHAQGTAFLVSPHVGLRASLSNAILFDLTAQYLVLAGGSNVSKLGGALLEASFGFAF